MNTDQAREFLIKFMEENFTDTTYHRYILDDTQRISLAGDFAWQIATAINDVQLASTAIIERQAREITALKAAMSADENAQPIIMSEDDAEQLARSKWTVKQWYEHVGAWENAQGELCFGSVMALGAMLKLMAKARHSIAPVTPQDAIKASTTPQRNLLIVFADILKDVASNEEIDDDWIANRFDFDLKWRHLTLKTGKLNCQDADDLAAAIDAARAKEQPQ